MFGISHTAQEVRFTGSVYANNVLLWEFSTVAGNFNVAHINAQSLACYWTDFCKTFTCQHIKAILISETWLKPKSENYSFPGYTLIRNDRLYRQGGGVAIFLRQNIPYEEVSRSTEPPPPEKAGEHLFVKVELNGYKLLLGVCYFTPKLDFPAFDNLLAKVISGEEVIIMGDFNTNLFESSTRKKFTRLVERYGLHVLKLEATHNKIKGKTPTWIDHILVSSKENVAKHGQCPVTPGISKHDLLYVSYQSQSVKCPISKILDVNPYILQDSPRAP